MEDDKAISHSQKPHFTDSQNHILLQMPPQNWTVAYKWAEV